MSLDFSMFYDDEGNQLPRPHTATQEDLERVVSKGKPLDVLQKFAELVELGVQWDWFEAYSQWLLDHADWAERKEAFEPSEEAPEFAEPEPVEPVRPEPKDHLEPYYIDLFRADRQGLLDEAVVSISTGKLFDADEQSIIRLSQALIRTEGLPDDSIIPWSTADVSTGVMVDCTRAEIKEAHTNAVDNMSLIWSSK